LCFCQTIGSLHACDSYNIVLATIQVFSDLEMAVLDLTKRNPEWVTHYNVQDIRRDQIVIDRPVGQGHFGQVCKATLYTDNGMQ
jgi:hypothetical protein